MAYDMNEIADKDGMGIFLGIVRLSRQTVAFASPPQLTKTSTNSFLSSLHRKNLTTLASGNSSAAPGSTRSRAGHRRASAYSAETDIRDMS